MKTLRRLRCAITGHRWGVREWDSLFGCWVLHCPRCVRVTLVFND